MVVLLCLLAFGFETGESLEYEAKYSFLSVGKMTLAVPAESVLGSDTVYHFMSEIVSNPKYGILVSLRDRLDSYSRKRDLQPLLFIKDVRERKYSNHVTVNFDHGRLEARYSDSSVVKILPQSCDLLGFYYKLRILDVAIGDTVVINNHADKKNYAVKVTALRREKVKTPMGEWNCILYEPQTKEKGIFGRDGKLQVWIADDKTRIPIMIKSKMSVGSLTFRVVRMEWGPGQ